MNVTFLAAGLGLDSPVIEAIREGLPATRALRNIVTFLLELGFSLVEQPTTPGYLTLLFSNRRRDADFKVRILYPNNASFCQVSAHRDYLRRPDVWLGLNIGLYSYVSVVISSMSVMDTGLTDETLMDLFRSRIIDNLD